MDPVEFVHINGHDAVRRLPTERIKEGGIEASRRMEKVISILEDLTRHRDDTLEDTVKELRATWDALSAFDEALFDLNQY